MQNKGTISVRDLNKKNILKIILNREPITRTEISDLIKISRPTASSYINELIDSGYVIEKGKSTPSPFGGKKAALLYFNSNSNYIIGIRIGERTLRIALTNLASKIIESRNMPTEEWKGPESIIDKIIKNIESIINTSGIDPNKILGIGIGCTGLVERKTGNVIFSPNLSGWKNIPLKKIVEEKTSIDTCIENDIRVQAIAEKNYGLAKNINNFLTFSTGIGIGTAVVLNNKLLVGQHGIFGEVGHLVIDIKSNYLCHCGNIGCLETLSNSNAIIRNIKKDLKSGGKTLLKLKEDFQLEDIYDLYKKGERIITDNINKNAEYIGIGISNAIKVFSPELVIIQGKYIGFGQKYLEIVKKTVKKYTFPQVPFKYKIEFSKLGQNIGVIGATSMIFEKKLLYDYTHLGDEFLLKKM
jgi:predicted NBD/HSP70 family sugar kinase